MSGYPVLPKPAVPFTFNFGGGEPAANPLLDWLKLKKDLDVRLGQTEDKTLCLLSVYDVMRIAGQRSGHNARMNKYMSCIHDHGITHVPVKSRWKDGKLTEPAGETVIPMFTLDCARKLVCYMLRRNQKSEKDIQELLALFDIPAGQFESSFVAMPEKDTLASIQRAIPFPSHQQFRVGDYRLDLYFPSVRIAVECNENRHAGYDMTEEMERRRFISEQLNCRIVSYDPFAHQFSVLDVVRDIVELLVCPEFQTYAKSRFKGPWAKQEEADSVDEQ